MKEALTVEVWLGLDNGKAGARQQQRITSAQIYVERYMWCHMRITQNGQHDYVFRQWPSWCSLVASAALTNCLIAATARKILLEASLI
jgi:hypothetical protein